MANNIITLTRGDTFDFDVTAYEEMYGNLYTGAQANDVLEFKVLKPNQDYFLPDHELPIVKRKKIEAEVHDNDCEIDCIQEHFLKYTFEIDHIDTINLPVGVYYYAVKLYRPGETSNKDQYLTLVDKTKFILNG
jgi:hypothetical protein